MHRLNDDYIVLTNREARELQQALVAGAEAAEQLAVDRFEAFKQDYSAREPFEAAQKLGARLRSWQKRIHRIWTFLGE